MAEETRLARERETINAFSDFGNVYNFKKDFNYAYKTEAGLTEDIVREISGQKDEPAWMLEERLKSLELFYTIDYPDWGPDISELQMDNIITYVRPDAGLKADWSEVPEDIKDTFDRLGIPEAEKTSLAGVGAQYDSEVVYHSIQEELVKQGVVYTDFDTALKEHEDIVRKHFMKLIPPTDHKFAALHGAVCSRRRGRKNPVAELFPSERPRGRPVRAHVDHRGKRRESALHRRLFRAEVQCRQPACRRCRALRRRRGDVDVLDD